MRWRRIVNEWNLRAEPWSGAVGIEEDDPDLAVPAIVCWFTRSWPDAMIDRVIELHNADVSADLTKCEEISG